MAKALEEILGDGIDGGLICVKYGHGMDLKKIRVLEAGHPVPDAAGENAAVRIAALLEAAGPRDVVISCISGGGSALLPAPADGISLKDKQDLTAKLLAAGADIQEINTLRKHVSLTKGGNLARLAYPAFVVNLMLSDVIGDDPGTIASGPFAPDGSTFRDALRILERYDLTERVPKPIIDRIRSGVEGSIQDTAKEGDIIFTKVRNVIVGSNILSLLAGQKKAKALGYNTVILSSSVQGDTREAAGFHYSVASEVRATGNPTRSPACLLSGAKRP
jgi:hydroxypyruvate reductase